MAEQGTVKWYNADKGYGFIAVETGSDVYVHHSAVRDRGRTLQEGQRVGFDVVQGARGREARDVVVLGE